MAKVFSAIDQQRFAKLSGDWNPMHMDPLLARRTQVGSPVVHGMHLVLWLLETIASRPEAPAAASSLEVRFLKPVYVGEAVDATIVSQGPNRVDAQVEVDGIAVVSLRLMCDKSQPHEDLDVRPLSRRSPPLLSMACELSLEEIAGQAGCVPIAVTAAEVQVAFPIATGWLGPSRLRALAALSYLVGMQCPGMHSIFTALAVRFDGGESPDQMAYKVRSVDKRFRLVRIDVAASGLEGCVEALARMPPTEQQTIAAIAEHVTPGEFAGQVALIVGGSRGLGEATAKIVAAGGGYPIITYLTGREDAARVAAEISSFGGRCLSVSYDATQPAAPQLEALSVHPTHLYYFATGPIARRKPRQFERRRFEEFASLYVTGFYEACAGLAGRSGEGIIIFYPSSVYVEKRPADLTEYAMAKAAGEILCADLPRLLPGAKVVVERLPRTLTDQTATAPPLKSADALAVLLPVVRKMQTANG